MSDGDVGHLLPAPADAAPTATVLQATRELLRAGVLTDNEDADARYAAIVSYLAVLSHRGIDSETLLKVALIPDILASLIAPILIDIIAPEVISEPASRRLPEWRQLLDLEPLESLERIRPGDMSSQFSDDFRWRFEEIVKRAERALASWISSATVDEIIRLVPPDDFATFPDSHDQLEPQVRDQYLWFRDRFSGRPVDSWNPRSVEFEYSWQKNRIAAPFNVEVMKEVSFDLAELSVTIADRVVGAADGWSNWPSLRDQVYFHAKRLLRSGRHVEAAALFEFFARQDGAELDSLNDRGFCLIPNDPGAALHFLELAEKRGYRPVAVNRYNQACCHVALGNHTSALAVAEFYWREWFEKRSVPATLWSRSGQVWAIEDFEDARVPLAQLAHQVAEVADDVSRASAWARRLAGIVDGSYVL